MPVAGRTAATTSTAYSCALGDELRRLREKFTPLTGHAFAEQLGWDPSKVSNIEKGKARASEIDLVQYLMTCGRDTGCFEEFRARYRHAFDPSVLVAPADLRPLTLAEAQATKVTSYDVLTVPALLQTPDYARALLESGHRPAAEVEKCLRRLMDRQEALRWPNSPECPFYVHELALRLRVGDEKVMADQYLRMLFATHTARPTSSTHNARTVRIVPTAAGPGPVRASPRTLLSFEKLAPLAYGELAVGNVFTHDGGSIADSREFFKWVDAIALDEGSSRRFLESL
ncbi:helix-turn-helix domain-containing protein [Lentzea sp. JNUCC 0626]|uniref:helix-turn-helix domain-containing protein n=1 Tax=Lentzea sp. JNUCC 0626 TaxID=3367513 RepID=UPI003748233E